MDPPYPHWSVYAALPPALPHLRTTAYQSDEAHTQAYTGDTWEQHPDTSELPQPSEERGEENDETTSPPRRRRKKRTVKPKPKPREIDNLDETKFDEGYDSYGEIGPFFDAVEEEGEPLRDEPEIKSSVGPPATEEATGTETPPEQEEANEEEPDEPRFVRITDVDIQQMTSKELKDELVIRGFDVTGLWLKPDLRRRLQEAMEREVPIFPPVDTRTGFSNCAYWEPLVPSDNVEDPTSSSSARAPDVPDDEFSDTKIPQKQKFQERFERGTFTGTTSEVMVVNNRIMRNPRDGTPRTHTVPRKIGQVDPVFIEKNGLTTESRPVEWMNAFLPLRKDLSGKEKTSVYLWTSYTNLKATIAGAGHPSSPFPHFTPFKPLEVLRFIGLYMCHGLTPTPTMEDKFLSQMEDPICGNDFVSGMMGTNARRRLSEFKAFFAVQDPSAIPPPRPGSPNHKVNPMLNHVQKVSKEAWLLGESIAGDVQTVGFHAGQHWDNLRTSYKSEKDDDGLQCATLCDDGYTYTFRFLNEEAPKRYLDQGLSPLHAQFMDLFDDLRDRFHRVRVDNNYLVSAKFCRQSYLHGNKVLLQGVTARGGRGLPQCVKQEEGTTSREAASVRGTVKAAVLKNDPGCPCLVAASVYDTKPFHFLSMSCNAIEWVRRQRRVWDSERNQTRTVECLRLSIDDDFKRETNDVDVADQLRNQYRLDVPLQKYKWWWALWMWGLNVMKVNAYVSYVRFMETSGMPESEVLSHFEFQKAICLAYLDPETHWIGYELYYASQRIRQKKREAQKEESLGNGYQSSSELKANGDTEPIGDEEPTGDTEPSKKKKGNARPKNYSRRMDDNSLSPTGALRVRLDRGRDHLPRPNFTKRGRCALHRWAAGFEYSAQLLCCPTCSVVLCDQCYAKFHLDKDIVMKKESLRIEYLRAKNKRKKAD